MEFHSCINDILQELISGQTAIEAVIRRFSNLPKTEEVNKIIMHIGEILYPGYREESVSPREDIASVFHHHLLELSRLLNKQIEACLPFRWIGEYSQTQPNIGPPPSMEEFIKIAREITADFLKLLPKIRSLVTDDIRAAYLGDPAAKSYGEVILSYPGLKAITHHRIAHELYKFDIPILPRMINEIIHMKTGIDIHPGATIGSHFFIDHGTGVVIGETTTIGNRVKIYQGVTLGAKSFPVDEKGNPIKGIKRHPTVEDDVVIYGGATILGGDVVIGEGSVIGGNVWLTESVPPKSMVTISSSPPKVKDRKK
jgi:serine O-acetyltransferase